VRLQSTGSIPEFGGKSRCSLRRVPSSDLNRTIGATAVTASAGNSCPELHDRAKIIQRLAFSGSAFAAAEGVEIMRRSYLRRTAPKAELNVASKYRNFQSAKSSPRRMPGHDIHQRPTNVDRPVNEAAPEPLPRSGTFLNSPSDHRNTQFARFHRASLRHNANPAPARQTRCPELPLWTSIPARILASIISTMRPSLVEHSRAFGVHAALFVDQVPV